MADERAPDTSGDRERLERFRGDPTRDFADWRWLWGGDHTFPVRRPGVLGFLARVLRRLLQPLMRAVTADERERQRIFNLILIEQLASTREQLAELDGYVRAIHRDHQGAIEAHADRLVDFDLRIADGMGDVMKHNDALFALVDQKLDRHRRETQRLQGRLGALIAAQETRAETAETASPALATAQREQTYYELERRQRGSEDEIRERIERYLPWLDGRTPVLDLGCGRGEALKILAEHGVEAYGVDASGAMVERCRKQGLRAEQGDLFECLAAATEESLGAIVSFHVVEHLPPASLERLVRLAWRALRPDGVLILETPSPLSLVMSARDFWIDPTHLRPVHPASLELLLREAGFEPVNRLDLHPYPDEAHLPEIELGELPAEQHELADRVNRLRDALDELLHGHRDFALVGVRV